MREKRNRGFQSEERPPILEALCLLSFAGSGSGALLYLTAALCFEKVLPLIGAFSFPDVTQKLSPFYFLLMGGFNLLSLMGVIRMWNLRRSGFYIYLLAQAAIFLMPLLLIGRDAFSSVVMIFTLVFAPGYALNYRKLN